MDRILGQPHAVSTLQRSLDSGRVHHAWVFHGPLGVGKFTTALEFARVLLDPEAGPDLAGNVRCDPQSRVAMLVDGDRHPDLHIIRKELALDSTVATLRTRKLRTIPIDLLRERLVGGVTDDDKFHDPIAYQSPMLGHSKVFIIDEAELMDRTSQNALLKTLEEPPKRTYIILITTQVDRLLPTIRSRCQQVAFTPLDEGSMRAWLARHDSELNVDDEQRAWILSFASGSPGLAMLAARDDLFDWHRTLQPILRRVDTGEFDAAFGPALANLVDGYAVNWVKTFKEASKEMANRDGVKRVMLLLTSHLNRRLRTAVERNDDPSPWLDLIDMLEENDRAIDANVNLKLVFESISAQWADIADRAVAAPGTK